MTLLEQTGVRIRYWVKTPPQTLLLSCAVHRLRRQILQGQLSSRLQAGIVELLLEPSKLRRSQFECPPAQVEHLTDGPAEDGRFGHRVGQALDRRRSPGQKTLDDALSAQ
jgi:hypothetical protein